MLIINGGNKGKSPRTGFNRLKYRKQLVLRRMICNVKLQS